MLTLGFVYPPFLLLVVPEISASQTNCTREPPGGVFKIWVLSAQIWNGAGLCTFNKLPGDADALGPQTERSNEDFEVRTQTLSQNKDLMGEKLPGGLTLWLLIILLCFPNSKPYFFTF